MWQPSRFGCLAIASLLSIAVTAVAEPKLRYETPKRVETFVGESVGFKIALVNEGNQPTTVFWPSVPHTDVYRFDIARPDGKKLEALRGTHSPVGRPKDFKTLGPGDRLDYLMFFDFPHSCLNCQEYAFPAPGEYTVKPSFASPIDEAVDPRTGETLKVPGAWVGVVEGEAFKIVVRPARPKVDGGHVTIKGHVVDKAGNLVSEVLLIVRRQQRSMASFGGFGMQDCMREYSRTDGRFAFGELPDSAPFFEIEAIHPKYLPSRLRIFRKPRNVEEDVKIVLDSGKTVRGVVRDTAGKPVAGARIRDDADYHKYVYSDVKGRFELSGVAATGHVRVHVWKDTYAAKYHSVATAKAESGEWVITLLSPQEKLRFAGRAVFADGTPMANLDLSFDLKTKERKRAYADAVTDKEGRYASEMKAAMSVGRYAAEMEPADVGGGTVWASQRQDHSSFCRRRWRSACPAFAAGSDEVDLVFENRGSIDVAVVPANAIPEAVTFTVICYLAAPPDGRWEMAARGNVGNSGGMVRFDRLGTGKYRVEVEMPKAQHWRWSKETELRGKGEGFRKAMRFALPKMRFGGLRARVLMPDGKTPLAKGSAWLDHTATGGGVPILDGKLEIECLPVGRAWLTVNLKNGAAPRVSGTIRAGKVTDLGDIVLKKAEDTAGWVQGKVLYDDTTPALGVGIVDETMINRENVGAGGKFRVRLPAGEATIVLNTCGAVSWPRPVEGIKVMTDRSRFEGPPGGRDVVLAPVRVEAGRTVTRDVTLPRKDMRKVSIKADLKGREASILLVVRREGCVVARPLHCCRLPLVVSDVPSGELLVILGSKVLTGYREFPAEVKDVEAIFDPGSTGTVLVKVSRPDGTPVSNAVVDHRPASLAWYGPVRGLRGVGFWPISTGMAVRSVWTKPDGTYRIDNLSAGRYLMELQGSRPKTKRMVEVVAGKTMRVEFISDAVPSGTPPLRQ